MAKAKQACTKKQCKVKHADLPLCCPMPGAELWNAHPRIYLPIEKEGEIACPYCGTKYTLAD